MAKLPAVKLRLDGDDALDRQLALLPVKLSQRVLTKALTKGANIITRDIRKRAKRLSKTLGKSIAQKVTQDTKRLGLVARLGAKRNSPGIGLAHLFEFGTKPRFREAFHARTGRMPKRPFMRPAFDSRVAEARKKIGTETWAGLGKAVVK